MTSFEIHTLDLRFQDSPEAIAAFLVVGPGGPVLVETGPGSTLPTLERELARFGFTPADIQHVLVTHIHLDHAGASGWWAQHGAQVYVHQVGAPHLVDPSKLLASAQRIYGDLMQPLWGEFLAAPPDHIHALHDGDVVEAAGLKFTALDTPGHARHHMVYRLDDIAFTGDLAGIRLGGRPHLRLPTPPPEFDVEEWRVSLKRVRAEKFARLYLTHFGPVDDVEAHWQSVESLVGEYANFVRQELERGAGRDEIVARFSEREERRLDADGLDAEARARYASVGPYGMAVDGLIRYWKKTSPPSPAWRPPLPPLPLGEGGGAGSEG
ncbi:MAG: MBL fold metallo-hydrolase [Chloroflexi bacterium]|nr:MBL fold metallo-hydrolase [Chloroflexota bacterium]